MNIAILCYHRIGGSGVIAYEIGRAMAEKGYTIHFIGLEPPFRLGDNFSKNLNFHKVWVHEYPVFNYPPYTLALASQLSEIIVEYDIDIIHSHYALPHAAAALLAKEISRKDVKCITTLHGTDITVVGSHPTMKNITRHAIIKSDHVTAVSNYLKKETERVLDIEAGTIQTIYNFVNLDMFNPALRNTSPMNKNGKTVILHMSNLRPVKEPLDVIRIFKRVTELSELDLELWIIGEGPLRPEMTILARNFSICDKIKYLGIRNIVGPLIAESDVFLLTSRQESLGLSLLEAMARGVPVVASNVGGIPELVEDSVSGILFTPGNIEEAARKTTNLLKDKRLYSKIKENALTSATTNFDRETIINQYEMVYLA